MFKSGKNKRNNKNSIPLNNILYTPKRTVTNYNDMIPVSEQKKQVNPLVKLFEKIHSAIGKSEYGLRPSQRSHKQRRQRPVPTASAVARESIFADSRIKLCIIICAAACLVTFFAVPIAFAREEVKVNLYDSGRVFTANTTAATVGEFLSKNNIDIGEHDYVEVAQSEPIKENMDIIIRRAMPVTIKSQDGITSVDMIAGTVADAIDEAQMEVKPQDEIYPSKDTYVRSGMTIDLISVEIKTVTETRTLGYQEIRREDDTMYEGDSEIIQYGDEGEKTIEIQQIYKNGVLYSEEVVNETVTKEPVNQIVAVGTKVYVEPKKEESSSSSSSNKGNSSSSSNKSNSSSGGSSKPSGGNTSGAVDAGLDPSRIKEVYQLECTAYCDSATATGAYPGWGTVAANPSFLPYGTSLYIEGYGYGSVQDTGGFISSAPYNLDLWMPSEAQCNSWGRRTVTVYVLY